MALTYKRIGSETSSNATGDYYNQSFLIANWNGPISGYYFLTIPQSTHNKTNNITVTVFEDVLGDFEVIETFVQINTNLDVTLRIDATVDTRFDGKVLIL